MIVMILGGVFVYFTEYKEKNAFSLSETTEITSGDFTPDESLKPNEPKFAWVIWMFAFALLLMIPCLGFVGAIKEHVCLLVLYGVIFFVEAIVFLIFKSFWFLLPTLVSLSSLGLVFLIRAERDHEDSVEGGSKSSSRMAWCLDKI